MLSIVNGKYACCHIILTKSSNCATVRTNIMTIIDE